MIFFAGNESFAIFAKNKKDMATTIIRLDKNIVNEVLLYTDIKSQNLSAIIEDYLVRLTKKCKKEKETKDNYPDIVMSLLGAGSPVSDNDLDGREAYHRYLTEKYK